VCGARAGASPAHPRAQAQPLDVVRGRDERAQSVALIKLKEPMKQATGVTKCHELEAALSGLATTARVRLVALVAAVARPTFIPNYKRSHLCHLG
jgi:hypothetical protein